MHGDDTREGRGPARPAVIAHRGASADFAEHSMAAFRHAIDVGADAIECDVRMTADGHLVCLHDRTTSRTANARATVSDRTLAELRRLDWAGGETGPVTMRELLSTVADAGRRVELAIETKHPTRHGGALERELVDLLDWFGWSGHDSPVRVMSFSTTALARARRWAPTLGRVFLVDSTRAWTRAVALGTGTGIRARPPRRSTGSGLPLPAGADVLGPSITLLRRRPPWLVSLLHTGVPLHVWTVDEQADVDACVEAGARGIITNRPGIVLQRLAELDHGSTDLASTVSNAMAHSGDRRDVRSGHTALRRRGRQARPGSARTVSTPNGSGGDGDRGTDDHRADEAAGPRAGV